MWVNCSYFCWLQGDKVFKGVTPRGSAAGAKAFLGDASPPLLQFQLVQQCVGLGCKIEPGKWSRSVEKPLERDTWGCGDFFLLGSTAQPLTRLHQEGRMGDPRGVQDQDQRAGLEEQHGHWGPCNISKLHPKRLHQLKVLALLREQFWFEEEAAAFSVAEDIVQHQLLSGLS